MCRRIRSESEPAQNAGQAPIGERAVRGLVHAVPIRWIRRYTLVYAVDATPRSHADLRLPTLHIRTTVSRDSKQ